MEFINKFLTFVFLSKIVVKIVIEKLKFSSISFYEIFVRGEYWCVINYFKIIKIIVRFEKIDFLEIFLQYCSCFSTKIENDLFHGWILVDKLSSSFFCFTSYRWFFFFYKSFWRTPLRPVFFISSSSSFFLFSSFLFFLYTRSNSSLVRNSLETLENSRSIIQNTF